MNGDNNLREILPLLRPRSAEPTLFSTTVWYLLWAGIVVLLTLYLVRWLRLRKRRLVEFQEAAHEAGLKASQTTLLYRIARNRKMRAPLRLLSSPQFFDREVGRYAAGIAAKDRRHPELDQIGKIRRALGFDELDLDQTLTSTRQIDRAQSVMMQVGHLHHEEAEHTPCLVLERDEGLLTLAPVLREGDSTEPRWKEGQELSGVFWREGDTEYRFVTRVIRADPSGETVDVEHGAVERLQNRDFYRIVVDFSADFYLLPADTEEEETVPDDAAIELLDREEAIRVAPSIPVDPENDENAEPDRLAEATRIHGHVVNLSAGGLAVDIPLDGPTGDTERWVVDPAFEGDFPLAGLTLSSVSSEDAVVGAKRVKLQFEDLPTPIEKEIVRSVYEHQLHGAGGRSGAALLEDVEDDDLPTA